MDRKEFLRSDIARGIEKGPQGVNRELEHEKGKGVIFGYAVLSKGKLNGGDCRDWEFDEKSLDQVVELGNKNKLGMKSRFGHPNMSTTALGTFLGRAKNFRHDGKVARADLYFDSTAYKTPDGDLATYVLDLAESDADAFGSSIVFDYELEYRLEKDGTKKKNKEGKDLPPLVRFKKLSASDIVDNPAANKGFFGTFFSESVKPSAEVTSFLDRFLNSPDAVGKTIAFLSRYQANRTEEGDRKQQKEEGKSMEFKDITVEMLKEHRPELVESLHKEGLEAGKEGVIKEAAEGIVTGERTRVLGIIDKGIAYGNMTELAREAVANGDSLEVAETKFKEKKLKDINSAAPSSPGPGEKEEESGGELSLEEKAGKEFDKDAKIRSEFKKKETYVAFKKAEKAGSVKILKK